MVVPPVRDPLRSAAVDAPMPAWARRPVVGDDFYQEEFFLPSHFRLPLRRPCVRGFDSRTRSPAVRCLCTTYVTWPVCVRDGRQR